MTLKAEDRAHDLFSENVPRIDMNYQAVNFFETKDASDSSDLLLDLTQPIFTGEAGSAFSQERQSTLSTPPPLQTPTVEPSPFTLNNHSPMSPLDNSLTSSSGVSREGEDSDLSWANRIEDHYKWVDDGESKYWLRKEGPEHKDKPLTIMCDPSGQVARRRDMLESEYARIADRYLALIPTANTFVS
ncbi:MAG: hypothetical protein M1814_005364 [Vezdaea aestivalis]|nr:MAG: hypothetical protein M1814_005364 [Vezdaea aestivalis]